MSIGVESSVDGRTLEEDGEKSALSDGMSECFDLPEA